MSSTKGAEHSGRHAVEHAAADRATERLLGSTAVVTGASRGVGLATARALIGEGARVVLLARSGETLRQVAESLGPRASAVVCDVTRPDDIGTAVERIGAELGGAPDVLVSNAGAFTLATVERTEPNDFLDALQVNLVAPFLLARAFLPDMRARGAGHIVSVGSIADRAVFPENGAYAASKHGVRALHEVLRLELRGSGVRATLVSPGPVDTPLWDPVDPDAREGFTPRAQMLQPEAVADAIVYALTQPASVNIDELRLSRS